jgi:hypothetical protein
VTSSERQQEDTGDSDAYFGVIAEQREHANRGHQSGERRERNREDPMHSD